MTDSEKKYADIITLPHHRSTRHAHMSRHDRAAQFSSFAALSGHHTAIHDTAQRHIDEIASEEQPEEAEPMP